jgi:tyrosinase
MIWRRNLISLSPTEKARFTNAVKELKKTKPGKRVNSPNKYNDFVLWHNDAADKATPLGQEQRYVGHGGPAFLPWHRYFIRRFELDLQSIIIEKTLPYAGITLPYWNWAEDSSKKWEDMAVWQDDFMGGNGNNRNNYIVDTGPFKDGDWTIIGNDGKDDDPLTRNFGLKPDRPSVLPTPTQVLSALAVPRYDSREWDSTDNTPSEASFRKTFEGLHNNIHGWVDGSMWPVTSPNDPVFFVHHCYVDREWDQWQRNKLDNDDYYPNDGTVTDGGGEIAYQNRSAKIFPWDTEPNPPLLENVLNSQKTKVYDQLIGVAYDPGNHGITAVARDKDSMDVFWIRPDGSVYGKSFYSDKTWGDPYPVADENSSSTSGSITAIARKSSVEVWWVGQDGSLNGKEGNWKDSVTPYWEWEDMNKLNDPLTNNIASTSGGTAAIPINRDMEQSPEVIWYIGCNSYVYACESKDGEWVTDQLADGAQTSTGIAAVSSDNNIYNVWKIGEDGSVYWYSDRNGWSGEKLPGIDDTSNNACASIAAASRDTGKMEVWWIEQDGSVIGSYSNDSEHWTTQRLANPGSASIRGSIAAVSRLHATDHWEVWWIGNDGSVQGAWHIDSGPDPGPWKLYTLAGPGSASTSGGITAVSRSIEKMEVWWVGKYGDINGAWHDGSADWRYYKLIQEIGSAATGLPSDVKL